MGTDSAQNGSCTASSQEEVDWGTQVSSCVLGLEGCLRSGISLTTRPKWLLGPARPPPGTGPHSPLWLPIPCLSSSDCCKVLPYMELKTASSAQDALRRFQRRAQFPSSPLRLRVPSPCGQPCFRDALPSLCGAVFGTRTPSHLSSHPRNSTAPQPIRGQEEGIPWDKTLRVKMVVPLPQSPRSNLPLLCPMGF